MLHFDSDVTIALSTQPKWRSHYQQYRAFSDLVPVTVYLSRSKSMSLLRKV